MCSGAGRSQLGTLWLDFMISLSRHSFGLFMSQCPVLGSQCLLYPTLFLGLHQYTPVLALNRDMGWDSSELWWKASMVVQWKRLQSLPSNRRASKILHWDLSVRGEWADKIIELLQVCGFEESTLKKWQWKWRSSNIMSGQTVHNYGQRKSGGSWNWELIVYLRKTIDVKNMCSIIYLKLKDH